MKRKIVIFLAAKVENGRLCSPLPIRATQPFSMRKHESGKRVNSVVLGIIQGCFPVFSLY